MTLKELVDFARRRLDDTKSPFLWADADLVLWFNEAQQEAARRARLLLDSVTGEVCQYGVSVADPLIAIDPRVLFIRRAKLASQDHYLNKVDVRDLDAQRPGWETEEGEVYGYVQNYDANHLRLVNIPETADTLNLTVTRLPLEDMAADSDEPEIKPHLHLKLHHWVLYRAYSGDDVDVNDATKAENHLAQFVAEFGEASTALDDQWVTEQNGYDDFEGARR